MNRRKKMRKLHTGAYGLVDSRRWKYLRLFEANELESGATRIVERRIAKMPWDFTERLTFGNPLFHRLYERYHSKGNRTLGVKETLKIIRISQVSEALTK